jgi:site-specific recombinase XerD
LRDAALLSLASDTGLCVAELVRVEVGHIGLEPDKTASLDIPTSKTGQEGQVRLPGFCATLCG